MATVPPYSTEPVHYEAAPAPTVSFDPLRYCVMTTVALLAWALSPAVMVVVMAGIGFAVYWRAIRGGLTRTRCVLRHPNLVLAYLGAACLAGIAGVLKGF